MQQQSTSQAIHPDTRIGSVTLHVSQLDRSLRFYEEKLGFRCLERTPGKAVLGTPDAVPLLFLSELPGAITPQPQWSTGLYHTAILLPSRVDLGRTFLHLDQVGINAVLEDHQVSEALYFSDPDGNGLEMYRDRPRSTWRWSNGEIEMSGDPLDKVDLRTEGATDSRPWDGLPSGTCIGHMHLKVGDIAQAEHFYHTILGFDITRGYPNALFMSAGGYHHHLATNTWRSLGAGPAPENTVGLQTFEVRLPNREALAEVQARLIEAHIPIQENANSLVVADPWGTRITLHVA